MNREILFRGFHQDESGEDEIVLDRQVIKGYWCFGYYVKNGNKDLIVSTLATSNEVISETVSQYTGKDDKNEHKIFDNDLLKPPVWIDNEQRPCLCIYNQENNANEIIGFGLYWNNSYFSRYQDLVCSDEWDEFEVIGTIFDKKEVSNE